MKAKINKSSAGKRGKSIRSDCYVEIIETKSGGISLELKSKVASMYSDSIKSQIFSMCDFFDLKNANIYLEDNGALPFVIAARFELAVKRLNPMQQKEFLIPVNKKTVYKTSKDRFRRSRLYLPGNEPKFFLNAGLHKPDAIILDLEDSVSYQEKDAAQLLVRNALRSVDFYGSEKMVRINQLPMGLDDLKFIIPHNIHIILIPKCESPEQVISVEEEVERIKRKWKITNDIFYMPIIESALGIIKAFEIVKASKNICALTIGLEDYSADIGTNRTIEGKESLFARNMIVNAAKAAGVQAIDSVFSDVSDMENLRKNTYEAKAIGFEGKGCIHPRQIKVIHECFAPTDDEIKNAELIVAAFEEAERNGIGVVSIGSKMIDAPIVKRAKQILNYNR